MCVSVDTKNNENLIVVSGEPDFRQAYKIRGQRLKRNTAATTTLILFEFDFIKKFNNLRNVTPPNMLTKEVFNQFLNFTSKLVTSSASEQKQSQINHDYDNYFPTKMT